MPGEIATAYVRLRPISDSFRSEATTQIKSSMAQLNRSAAAQSAAAIRSQVDLAKKSNVELALLARQQAATNVEAGAEQIRELKAIGREYAELAADARLSADQQAVAARLAEEANAKAMIGLGKNTDRAEKKTHSLTESVKGLAATFGSTIGAIAAVNLFKEVINGAAQGQKALEAINAQFGKSGVAIKRWAEGAATALGVSAAAAESTATRFGIAYRQIGLSQPVAARMTLGFEKLAASIAAIRGIKPDAIFSSLALAATGNTRSLRTLGITIDQTQLKYAAFKLGITDTITNALNPAQKAEAVYAIATARLGQYQTEAKKHVHDLANEQLRLSAAWSNAKDIIGTALLPDFTKLITKIADWLVKMEKSGRLQKDVNKAVHDATVVVNILKSAFNLIVPPIEKVVGAVGGLKHALVILAGVIGGFKFLTFIGGFKRTKVEADLATGAINKFKLAAIGLQTLAEAGPILLAITAAVTIVTNKQANAERTKAQGFLKKNLGDFIGGGLGALIAGPQQIWKDAIKKPIQNVYDYATQTYRQFFGAGGKLDQSIEQAQAARNNALLTGTHAANSLLNPLDVLTSGGRNISVAGIRAAGQQLANAYRQSLASAAITADAQKQIAALKHQLSVGDATANSIFNQEVKARLKSASDSLSAAIQLGNYEVAQAVKSGQALIGAAQANLKNYILRGSVAINQALVADQEKLRTTGKQAIKNLTSLGSTLISDLGKFQSALSQQKTNLTGVGPFGAAEALLKQLTAGGASAQLQQAITNVKAQVGGKNLFKGPKGEQTASQKLSEAKRLVSAHISLLVEQAQKGQITVKQLAERLNGYLEKSGFTYKKIAHLLGTTGADKIRADVKNLTSQLDQINLLPVKLRKQLLAQSNNGLTNPVVSISGEIAKLRNEEKQRQTKYDIGLRRELAAQTKAFKRDQELIAKAHRTANQRVAKAEKHLSDVKETESLRVAQHHLQEARKQTGLLKKIHAVLQKAASAQAAIASVQVGPTGFPSSTKANPGHTAHAARVAGAAGIIGAGG